MQCCFTAIRVRNSGAARKRYATDLARFSRRVQCGSGAMSPCGFANFVGQRKQIKKGAEAPFLSINADWLSRLLLRVLLSLSLFNQILLVLLLKNAVLTPSDNKATANNDHAGKHNCSNRIHSKSSVEIKKVYTKNGLLAIRIWGRCRLVSLEAFKVCCRRGLDPCEGQPKQKHSKHDAHLDVPIGTGRNPLF
ncbi:hypothetical protein HDN1F_35440 [gamma proteobacterium HdN1]|nr:Hypothetical protein HDN1F_17750 [gamma proteobacterium HdN1]CBL47127.1 hypothetical protein HDN1F_35440 [gamma proteobacterium HdN1]